MTIDVEPPARSSGGRRRRDDAGREHGPKRAWAVAGTASLVLAATAALAWWAVSQPDGVAPAPSPTPTPTAVADTGPTAAEETALVYEDWLRWRDVAECFTEAGFPREPFLRTEVARVPRVARFLGIEAATDDPSLPSPELRWVAEHGPGGPHSARAQELTDPASPDSCVADSAAPRGPDATVVQDAVVQARADQAFLDVLAEYAWVAENPAHVALAHAVVQDEFEATTADAAAQEEWSARLDRVLAALSDQMVVVTSGATDQYAHAAGLGLDGRAVVVRVSGRDAGLVTSWTRNWGHSCGDVVVNIGADGRFNGAAFGNVCAVLDPR